MTKSEKPKLVPKPNRTPPKSNQDAFNRVWTYFVVNQAPLGMYNGYCEYRTKDNAACAVGCMMPRFMCVDVSGAIRNIVADYPSYRIWFKQTDVSLLSAMQNAHDKSRGHHEIEVDLKRVAREYSLTIPK